MSDHINELYDKDGELIGALLSAEAWKHVRSDVLKACGLEDIAPAKQEVSEPISDWETLKQYWDYKYPVDMDVHCEQCGSSTQDWSADEPRKFYLSSANLAGLVSFKCVECASRVVKKHFDNEIIVECTPPQERIQSKEGRY